MDTSAILLVDDEPVIQERVAMLLESAGYRVFDAYNGPDALQLLDKHREITHLLTDVYMAGMSGVELAHEARSRPPNLCIILTSCHDPQHTAEFPFLQKPWRMQELQELILQTERPGGVIGLCPTPAANIAS